MMRISDNGKRLLAQWEGMSKTVYDDVAGLKTIGVGHLLTKDEIQRGVIVIHGEAINYQAGLSEDQVLELLAQDLKRFEDAVNEFVEVELNQNQFDSLVSFSFNVGVRAFKESTLLKRINGGGYDDVPNQFARWVKAGGETVDGLVNRRNNEINLWLA